MRPIADGRADDVVDRDRLDAVHVDVERRQLDDAALAGERAARAPPPSSPASSPTRKPTRPKLTPITGTAVSEELAQRAQHRPVAAEDDRQLGVLASTSSTPRCRGDRLEPCACAGLDHRRGVPTTATGGPAQPTAASIQRSSSAGRPAPGAVDEVEEELTVSLRAGQTRVYDAGRLRIPLQGRLGDLSRHSRARLVRGDDAALADLAAAGLELRLDEHDGLPARRRRAGAPAAAPCARR